MLVALRISTERYSLLSPLKKIVFLIVALNEQKVFNFVAKMTSVYLGHRFKQPWKNNNGELLQPREQVTRIKLSLFGLALRLPQDFKWLPLRLEELKLVAAPGFPLPEVLWVFFDDFVVWVQTDDPRRRGRHLLLQLLGWR